MWPIEEDRTYKFTNLVNQNKVSPPLRSLLSTKKKKEDNPKKVLFNFRNKNDMGIIMHYQNLLKELKIVREFPKPWQFQQTSAFEILE